MTTLPDISGAQLGAQLWLGEHRPLARRFRPPAMRTDGATYRERNQSIGGLWSSTLTAGPSSAFVEWCRVHQPGQLAIRGRGWWRLDPQPDARLLQIDDPGDYAVILATYPYQGGAELDFDAIAHDGWAGLNLTDHGVDTCGEAFIDWGVESTLWLSWAFSGEARRLAPPAWFSPAPGQHERSRGRRPRKKTATRRYYLSGDYRGWWFRAQPLAWAAHPKAVRRELRRALRARDAGVSTLFETTLPVLDVARVLIDAAVTAHNFTITGLHGERCPYPLGPGMCDVLPLDLVLQMFQLLTEHEAFDDD